MNSNSILKNQIIRYLLENPIDDDAPNKYAEVRKEFNIDVKTASRYWIEAKQKHLEFYNKIPKVDLSHPQIQKILKQEGENLSVMVNTDTEVKTLEQLLAVCEVDSSLWKVISWQCKKWDLGIKNTAGSIETKQLFSVSAKFTPIKIETDLVLQKQVIMDELFAAAPSRSTPKYNLEDLINVNPHADNMLELALFDVHFGKLAHREEVGEDYDLKIASERFMEAVKDLLSRVRLDSIERIFLPIGQDLINVDNIQGTTTGGTPQDTDSRFHKIVKTVKAVLIETINMLKEIAPVDVVIVVGNHDEQTTFMIGEMLEAYYHNIPEVEVYNQATLRKYYKYGISSIMLTHGNKEKFNELGMLFAAENPTLWASTEQRFIQLGHFHHNKKVTTIQAQDFQGFQVQILPSLSGSDAWHTGKGYKSLKQAKAFIFNRFKGLVGEFTHSAV